MTIGIYCIQHKESGKKYIGKSINVISRLKQHRYWSTKPERNKDCNRYFHAAVQKYGWDDFTCHVLEKFDHVNEIIIRDRELYWIDFYNSCHRDFGYNLRRDSSTGMITSEDTRKLQSIVHSGTNNANYGNRWNDEQKENMSELAINRHKYSGKYGDEWKAKISAKSTECWKDENKKAIMAKNVSKAKEKYDFLQYKDGWLLKKWSSIKDIIDANPDYKWQNIYSVCNGYKKRYMGFVWKKKMKISI